ncbi:hypothetical protein F66182_13253, partial [Fusarium sp. NRRL 66182]
MAAPAANTDAKNATRNGPVVRAAKKPLQTA